MIFASTAIAIPKKPHLGAASQLFPVALHFDSVVAVDGARHKGRLDEGRGGLDEGHPWRQRALHKVAAVPGEAADV